MADIGNRLGFETLTVGNAITTSDLPADWSVSGTGGTLTVVAKTWDHGVQGAQFNNATSSRAFLKSGSFGTAVACQTVYFILDTVGSAAIILSGGSGSANWRLNVARTVQARNNTTAVGTASGVIITADGTTVYRAEHSTNPGAGTQQLKVFLADDNASPLYDSGSQTLVGTARTNFQFGATAAAAGMVVTVLAAWVADTAFTGPITTPPITPLFTYNLGSAPWYASHRGAYGPEEVLQAYQTSLVRSPTSGLECDLNELSDGWALLHDSTVDRTADATSPITTGAASGLTKAQFRTVLMTDLSSYGLGVRAGITLDDWATAFGPSSGVNCWLMPEVKTGSNATQAASDIIAAGIAPRSIVQAFSFTNASILAAAGLETLFLMASGDAHTFAQVKAAGINHIGRSSALWDATQITNALAAGLHPWVFTIDTLVDRGTWLALGMEGFFSNQPALLNPPPASVSNFSQFT